MDFVEPLILKLYEWWKIRLTRYKWYVSPTVRLLDLLKEKYLVIRVFRLRRTNKKLQFRMPLIRHPYEVT